MLSTKASSSQMPRWRASLALALLASATLSCNEDALAPGVNACVAAGGRCVARATEGPEFGLPQCDPDELAFSSPPELCDEPIEDCCFRRCPRARPQSGDACGGRATCQYQEGTTCVQALCINGTWWLAIAECP
jgi:hypothetical protein